jgi:hypothetical protein
MDDIVRQAMAKWPNVPHCYGWLRLDARGGWRMLDERAQALHLPGERINNPALLEFIHRNYTHDEQGQWYFQNGPQRVYADLEVTPFIVRTDPAQRLTLHSGLPFPEIDTVWMTEYGQLILHGGGKLALLDDRDLGQCLDGLRIENKSPSEDTLSEWLSDSQECKAMTWHHREVSYPVHRVLLDELAGRFHFIQRPRRRTNHLA